MTRREGVSLLHQSYSFRHKHLDENVRLWPSVRKELSCISSLLPLFRMKLNCGWGDDVMASDSSPWGAGACSRKLNVATVQYNHLAELARDGGTDLKMLLVPASMRLCARPQLSLDLTVLPQKMTPVMTPPSADSALTTVLMRFLNLSRSEVIGQLCGPVHGSNVDVGLINGPPSRSTRSRRFEIGGWEITSP